MRQTASAQHGGGGGGSDDEGAGSSSFRRPRLTAEERQMLEDIFQRTPHPNYSLRQQLAGILGTNQRSVQIWFQNQRAKVKAAKRVCQASPHIYMEHRIGGRCCSGGYEYCCVLLLSRSVVQSIPTTPTATHGTLF
jgi:hypothetical protein